MVDILLFPLISRELERYSRRGKWPVIFIFSVVRARNNSSWLLWTRL